MKFIKLSTVLINPRYIHTIKIQSKLYSIRMVDHTMRGVILMGAGTGGGTVMSDMSKIDICEKESPLDFKRVSEWLEQNTTI